MRNYIGEVCRLQRQSCAGGTGTVRIWSRCTQDGRVAGLSKETAMEGIARAIRDGRQPSLVKVILKDGSIFDCPG